MPELSTTIIVPWNLVSEGLPPTCEEVIGFAKDWIDPDYNPEGQRPCFIDDNGYWIMPIWCNNCEEYHTINTAPVDPEIIEMLGIEPKVGTVPTHWMPKPISPK